jgi:hypothetical protein
MTQRYRAPVLLAALGSLRCGEQARAAPPHLFLYAPLLTESARAGTAETSCLAYYCPCGGSAVASGTTGASKDGAVTRAAPVILLD